ncbi:MAG: DUF4170 domain-containing protein [Rhodospirillaceae bacterium]|nr:DUF4170 domain-containing protein [Rhodospirillaceae bacterium]
MAEQSFLVIGGEYADTSFTEPAPGTKLEAYGPCSEREAKVIWRDLTGRTVDNAMVRYFIKSADEVNGKIYWVVGGEYADSKFTKLASGKQLEVYGPFEKWEALGFWRGLTSKTVDDAMVRYDLRKNYDPEGGGQMAGNPGGGPVTTTIDIKLSGGKAASVVLTRPDGLDKADSQTLIGELESALAKLKGALG